MKQGKYILCWLPVLLCLACDSNPIDEYELGAKLNFYNSRMINQVPEKICQFSDEDYVNGVAERLDSVRVDIMGNAQEENRFFYCTTAFETDRLHVEVQLEDRYVMPARSYSVYIQFKVRAPERFGIDHVTSLCFDNDRNSPFFSAGLSEQQTCRIIVSYLIRPEVWHETIWGTYSNGKYKFMMDEFKDVYGNIKRTYANRVFIKKQYEEYRKNNPPILDDQIPAQEIEFV